MLINLICVAMASTFQTLQKTSPFYMLEVTKKKKKPPNTTLAFHKRPSSSNMLPTYRAHTKQQYNTGFPQTTFLLHCIANLCIPHKTISATHTHSPSNTLPPATPSRQHYKPNSLRQHKTAQNRECCQSALTTKAAWINPKLFPLYW